MTTQKDGASAQGVQRVLGLSSYGTAWTMLHRLRTAMVRPRSELLTGDVEVDETFLGGPRPGKRGRGAGNKQLVVIAIERTPHGFDRCRLSIIPGASALHLGRFIRANVETRSAIITDGLPQYRTACGTAYTHKPFAVEGSGVQGPRAITRRTSGSPPAQTVADVHAPGRRPLSTCRHTSMSSASGSTVVAVASVGCSFTTCSHKQSRWHRAPRTGCSHGLCPRPRTQHRHPRRPRIPRRSNCGCEPSRGAALHPFECLGEQAKRVDHRVSLGRVALSR